MVLLEEEVLSMAKAISITFATCNQALKLESSFPYYYFSIPLLETHDWIDLLPKRDGMEGEIDGEKTDDGFI